MTEVQGNFTDILRDFGTFDGDFRQDVSAEAAQQGGGSAAEKGSTSTAQGASSAAPSDTPSTQVCPSF